MTSSLRFVLGSAVSFCLSACGGAATPPPAAESTPAEATATERGVVDLFPKTRSQMKGSLALRDVPEGLSIKGKLKGVESGSHGFTLHESGDCTAHDAKSVGPVWNPSAADPPAGILGNIVGNDETGEVEVDLVVPGLSVRGEHSVLGHAVVIHAWPLDPAADLTKVPFLACGVIEARAAL